MARNWKYVFLIVVFGNMAAVESKKDVYAYAVPQHRHDYGAQYRVVRFEHSKRTQIVPKKYACLVAGVMLAAGSLYRLYNQREDR